MLADTQTVTIHAHVNTVCKAPICSQTTATGIVIIHALAIILTTGPTTMTTGTVADIEMTTSLHNGIAGAMEAIAMMQALPMYYFTNST